MSEVKEKKAVDKNVLVNVNGLEIRVNSIYKITSKPDAEAPSGFVEEGTTKLPSVGIGNTVPCRFVVQNKSTGDGVYDTGFYVQSPCYAGKTDAEKKSLVAQLKKSIVKPYEEKYGKPGVLDNSNTEFWDSFGVDLVTGRVFSTENVEDLLGLYVAMRGFELTPKKDVGNPKFNESQFCIEDKAVVKSVETERALEMMESISNMTSILKANKSKLTNIFKYLGLLSIAEDVDVATLNTIGYQWLHSKVDNPKKFLKVFALTQNEATEEVVDLYVVLSKLSTRGVIEKISGSYYYGGEFLGADLKTSTNNLNSNAELEEIKVEILEKI